MYDYSLPPELFSVLLDLGFRRSGTYYYKPYCPGCTQCKSYRVVLSDFSHSRSQKRILKKNRDLEFQISLPKFTRGKEELYLKYQYFQHFKKDRKLKSIYKKEGTFNPDRLLESMYYQMYTNPSNSIESHVFLDGKLLGFGILDITKTSVSTVYFVFDPDLNRRSLGTYSILKEIEWAQKRGLRYYHLGFYIHRHPKMDYKKYFKKAQVLDPVSNDWIDFRR
jgi:arginine-tRNA-protein transferase